MENEVKSIGSNGMKTNIVAGTHQNQDVGGGQKAFVVSRVFVAVVTKNSAMPMPDGNSYWVVRDQEGKPALEPVKQTLLAVPPNAVLSISLEDCVGLLFYARNVLLPDMTDFSGVQVNVVHTEAVYNSEKGSISTEMSLYPTQYIPLATTKITTNNSTESESGTGTDTNVEEENSDSSEDVKLDVDGATTVADDNSAVGSTTTEEGADEDVQTEKEEGSK